MDLDKQIMAIQRSTKTLFSVFLPSHNKLRSRFKWYHKWHTKKYSTTIHVIMLSLWITASLLLVHLNLSDHSLVKISKAGSTCTASVTGDWSNPATWGGTCNAGALPLPGDTVGISNLVIVTLDATVDLTAGGATSPLTMNGGTISLGSGRKLTVSSIAGNGNVKGSGELKSTSDLSISGGYVVMTESPTLTIDRDIITGVSAGLVTNLAASSTTINLGRNLSGAGAVFIASGTNQFNLVGSLGGTLSFNSPMPPLINVSVIGSGTWTANTILLSGTLTVENGSLGGIIGNGGSRIPTINVTGGTLTGNVTATTLNVSGTGSFIPGSSTVDLVSYSHADSSTIDWTNSTLTLSPSANFTLPDSSYNNLNLTPSILLEFDNGSPISINGNFSLNSNARLSSSPIDFTGSGTQNFTANSSYGGSISWFSGGVTHSGSGTLKLLGPLVAKNLLWNKQGILDLNNLETVLSGGQYKNEGSVINGNVRLVGTINLYHTGTGGFEIGYLGSHATISLFTDLTVTGLSIPDGSSVDLRDNFLTLTGNGTVLSGPGSLSSSSARIKFTGSSVNVNSMAYNYLELGGTGTYTLVGNITVGYLLINSGATLDAGNNFNINTTGSPGVWNNAGGTFVPRSGAVTFTGNTAISGNNIFNNLSISSGIIQFASGSTQTINGTFTSNGSSGNRIILKKTDNSGSAPWSISAANYSVSYLNVSDSTALTSINAKYTSTDSGGNSGWTFNQSPTASNLGPDDLTTAQWSTQTKPTFSFSISDPDSSDGQQVKYQIQIANNINFENPVIDSTSELESVGDKTYTSAIDLPDSPSYYWRVKAIDSSDVGSDWLTAGSQDSPAFKIDITIGNALLSSNPTLPTGNDGYYKYPAPEITLSGGDSGVGTETIYYRWGTDGNYQIYSSPLTAPEGTNTLYYYSVDQLGNSNESNPDYQVYKVDSLRPAVTRTTSPDFPSSDGYYITNAPLVTLTASDVGTGLAGIYYKWNTASSYTLYSNPVPAPDGISTFSFYSIDLAGNLSSDTPSSFDYKVDLSRSPQKEEDKTIAQKVIDIIKSIIPQGIMNAVGGVLVSPVSKKISNFAQPISQAVATVSLVPLVANVFGTIPQIFNLLNYLMVSILEFFGIRRKRDPWGRVYNSVDGKPIDLAVVRIFDAQHHLIESRVTDFEGRFGFLVHKGKYYVEVKKDGLTFPSHLAEFRAKHFNEKLGLSSDVYLGKAISVKNDDETVNLDIPLDPVALKLNNLVRIKIAIRYALDWLEIILSYTAKPFLIVGVLVSLFNYGVYTTPRNGIVLLIYLFLGLIFIWQYYFKKRSYGKLIDSRTGKPVINALVSLYDKEYNTLRQTQATDHLGRFHFLVRPGRYYVSIEASGYVMLTDPAQAREKFHLDKVYNGSDIHFSHSGYFAPIIVMVRGKGKSERDMNPVKRLNLQADAIEE